MKFSLPSPPPGYAVPSATAPVSTAQLKQAVTLGQDLAAYTTYEVYPTFAVTARGDGYGAFWRSLSFKLRYTKLYLEEISLSVSLWSQVLLFLKRCLSQDCTAYTNGRIRIRGYIPSEIKCQEGFYVTESLRAIVREVGSPRFLSPLGVCLRTLTTWREIF